MTKKSFLCPFLDLVIKNGIKMENIKHEKKSDHVSKVFDEAYKLSLKIYIFFCRRM